jgi:hypothetical protein
MVTTRASAGSKPANVGSDDQSPSGYNQAPEADRRKNGLPSLHAKSNKRRRKKEVPHKYCEANSKAELDLLQELGVFPQPPESTAQAAARCVLSDKRRHVLSEKRTKHLNYRNILEVPGIVGQHGSIVLTGQEISR